MKPSFAAQVMEFYKTLELTTHLPNGVAVMNPFKSREVRNISGEFFKKYYQDNNPRTFILGINPGRFGAGVTGITFTDPVRLEKECGIPNSFEKRPELSSVFIYEMITRYGGPETFYSNFYLSAVCPLGFMKDGRNMNYYDDRVLEACVRKFIVFSLKEQIRFGAIRDKCFCLGEGKNYQYLEKLNQQYQFFNKIIPLAHPRFIMQYRLKKKEEFIQQYLRVLHQD
jgi:hypothetical protein